MNMSLSFHSHVFVASQFCLLGLPSLCPGGMALSGPNEVEGPAKLRSMLYTALISFIFYIFDSSVMRITGIST